MPSLFPNLCRPLLGAAAAAFIAALAAPLCPAEEAPAFSPEEIEFFEKKVRPVLAESCHDCHAGRRAKIGLHLDSRAGVLKGSDYRRVVDLENPAASLLLLAVKHEGGDAKVKAMPEKGPKLDDDAIAALERWIALGLPWPEERDASLAAGPGSAADHWAFQPVARPGLPQGSAEHPVDRFIERKLAEAGLEPAPRAGRATLYRRAHQSLLGLPPKHEEAARRLADDSPDAEAWPALVDHLLGSPHYGERWARHWMDVARYSDTKGYEAGGRERRFVYSHVYRDWLIRSFNEDLPYDQFLLYQLAAEQLADRDDPAQRPHLGAMGFLTLSKNGAQEEIFDDRIDTTFRGLQALTVSCARCHDHKSDPVGTAEYYGIYGVFLNSVEPEDPPVVGEPPAGPEYEVYLAELAEKQKVVDDFLEPKLAALAEQFPEIANRRAALMGKLEREDRRKLSDLQRVVDAFVADSQMEPDRALILEDRAQPINQHVFIRGNPGRRGDLAPRRFLSVLAGEDAAEFAAGSGRLELARAIASRDNPLTARVMVNRVWAWHFGEGLVRTTSDFGIEGDRPSHPELLDWLAAWFMEEGGWSVKKLHRLILTSETWRRASSHPGAGQPASAYASADPENRLLWRQNRQRLGFEQMHDALLDVSLNLDNQLLGPSVKILEAPFANRRAVYAYIDRQNLDPVFRFFDFSNPQEHTGERPRTSIPMQALFLLNNGFVQEQAKQVAARPEAREAGSPEAKVQALYRAVFARDPDEEETRLGTGFVRQAQAALDSAAARQTLTEWSYGYGGVDPETSEVEFRPLPHWDGTKWQAGEEYPLPDDPRSYLTVRRDGGAHPGSDSRHAVIMRWTAPRAAKVDVAGEVTRHESVVGKGDGLVAKVVVSGSGVARQEIIPPENAAQPMAVAGIEVGAGDTIDFVVDPGAHPSFDSFNWQPEIRDAGDSGESWSLTAQYSGPPDLADAWSTYAQALLGSNEFQFVD